MLPKLADFCRLHSMTYQLITQEPDYAMFSNTAYNDGRGTGLYNSIENMHNAIHAIVGNGGHMVCNCADWSTMIIHCRHSDLEIVDSR